MFWGFFPPLSDYSQLFPTLSSRYLWIIDLFKKVYILDNLKFLTMR